MRFDISKFKYYLAKATGQAPASEKAVHTNFLRTGRIARSPEDWVEEERRFLSDE